MSARHQPLIAPLALGSCLLPKRSARDSRLEPRASGHKSTLRPLFYRRPALEHRLSVQGMAHLCGAGPTNLEAFGQGRICPLSLLYCFFFSRVAMLESHYYFCQPLFSSPESIMFSNVNLAMLRREQMVGSLPLEATRPPDPWSAWKSLVILCRAESIRSLGVFLVGEVRVPPCPTCGGYQCPLVTAASDTADYYPEIVVI